MPKQVDRTSFAARRAKIQSDRQSLDDALKAARTTLVSNPADDEALALIESAKSEIEQLNRSVGEIDAAEARSNHANSEAAKLAAFGELRSKVKSLTARKTRISKLLNEWIAVVGKLGPLNYAIEKELADNGADAWSVIKAAHGVDGADRRWHPLLQSAARVSGTGVEMCLAAALWNSGINRVGVQISRNLVDVNRCDTPDVTIEDAVGKSFEILERALDQALAMRAKELGIEA